MTHRGLFTWIPSPEGMEQSEDEREARFLSPRTQSEDEQEARFWNSEDEREALEQAEASYWAYWPDRLLAKGIKRPPIE